MSKHEHSPRPWTHWTGPRGTSAVLDAVGRVVSGSMIVEQSPQSIADHRLIVASVSNESVRELRPQEHQAHLEREVVRLKETVERQTEEIQQMENRIRELESKLRAVGELPEKWRWEVELMCTEIGHTVKHAVETRADELDALLEKE